MNSIKQIAELLAPWIRKLELESRDTGKSLTPEQLIDARSVGIVSPEKIRIVLVKSIPSPENKTLKQIADQMQFNSDGASGLTARYGIYVNQLSRILLLHEFVHVSQYEEYESISEFLFAYIEEVRKCGYFNNPFEQEARRLKR
jgi:hypothetical protein